MSYKLLMLPFSRKVITLSITATALAAACVGLTGAQPAGATSQPRFLDWHLTYKGSQKFQFETVSAVNQRDAWVAGIYEHTTTAFIWRWNGTRWSSEHVPDASGFQPWYSDESSANDVWFVGYQNTANGQVLRGIRWTASGWKSQPMPAGAAGFLSLRVLGWNDAWLADSLSCPADSPASERCSSLLWHWNGHAWQQYSLPMGITTVTASSASNVWVAGYTGDGGKTNELRERFYAYRWTGSGFTKSALPHTVSIGCIPEIDTTSPSNVWMTTCAVRGKDTGLLLHWNGHTWKHYWNVQGEWPIIDGKLGVWLDPTMRWTPEGIGFAQIAVQNGTMTFPSVTQVPGTTTLLAVGLTWTSSPNHAHSYMAIVGGPFGRFKPALSSDAAATAPAAQQGRVALTRNGAPSRW